MSRIELRSASGLRANVDTFGAEIASLSLQNDDGTLLLVARDGKTVGRYSGRIARGTFELDGNRSETSRNEGLTTLHGGANGFGKREWAVARHALDEVELTLVSPDLDQGFPGELRVRVRYIVGPGDTLEIRFRAETSAPTVLNLTNHAYFRFGDVPIEEHRLRINASRYLPLDSDLIPTGEMQEVTGTRFDLRAGANVMPFDDCWLIDGDGLRLAAELSAPRLRRTLRVFSTEPAIVCYSKDPRGIALETQHPSDAPNRLNFPSTVLRPGEVFESITRWEFERIVTV